MDDVQLSPVKAMEKRIEELKEKLERAVEQREGFEIQCQIQELEFSLEYLKQKGYK